MMHRSPLLRSAHRTVPPAFSIAEVVMVVVIIGMLATIAVPRYANFTSHQRTDAAALRIELDLALAQRDAKYSSASRTVRFNVAGNSYTVDSVGSLDHTGQAYTVSLSAEPYGATLISAAFGGDANVAFDGFGAPDTGGTVVVRAGRYQSTVTLETQTGRVLRVIEPAAQ